MNYRPVRPAVVPRKVMQQITVNAITQHMKDNQRIRTSQNSFGKDMSCLPNLISYDQATCLVDVEKVVDVFCLNFNKAFLSHSFPENSLQKRAAHGLDFSLGKNCLDG